MLPTYAALCALRTQDRNGGLLDNYKEVKDSTTKNSDDIICHRCNSYLHVEKDCDYFEEIIEGKLVVYDIINGVKEILPRGTTHTDNHHWSCRK